MMDGPAKTVTNARRCQDASMAAAWTDPTPATVTLAGRDIFVTNTLATHPVFTDIVTEKMLIIHMKLIVSVKMDGGMMPVTNVGPIGSVQTRATMLATCPTNVFVQPTMRIVHSVTTPI